MPTIKVVLLRDSSRAIEITLFCSSLVIVGDSPVDPKGTMPSIGCQSDDELGSANLLHQDSFVSEGVIKAV